MSTKRGTVHNESISWVEACRTVLNIYTGVETEKVGRLEE